VLKPSDAQPTYVQWTVCVGSEHHTTDVHLLISETHSVKQHKYDQADDW
jgi:hypothetical protein